MSFTINNVATVWLPFGKKFDMVLSIYGVWNETVTLSDPNNVTGGLTRTGTGLPMNPSLNLGSLTTPANYGDLPAYPINVTVTNSGAPRVSYVNVMGWNVTSYDQLPNGNHNNLYLAFIPMG